MIWGGIIDNELVVPFKVEDGVKIDSAGYTQFLERNLMLWMKKKTAAFKKYGIYAGQRTFSCFQIHQRMVCEERHQKRPLDDLATCLSRPQLYRELLVTAEEGTLRWRKTILIKGELVGWDGGNYKEVKERCSAEFDCYNGLQTGEDH